MTQALQVDYEFGRFILLPTEKRLLCGNTLIPLAPKAFDTLVLLVENQGRLIQKDELLRTLWPDTVVEEVALAHNISQLRKALGDRAEDPKFIETVPKRGYRFIAPVHTLSESSPRASETKGSGVPSPAQQAAWSRKAIPATLTVALVLVAATAGHLYRPRTANRLGEAPPAIHSLAVLPLENLSGDKEQEYFSDGITDALITDLAQIGSLRVISRTSAMQFKGSKKSLPQIGRDLKVDAVVEGTVTRGERRVRITTQLIETNSDHHLWARTYERDLKDVLVLQDEIAQDVAEQIRVKLTPKERSLLTQVHTVDPEAHDAYLRGRYWWYAFTFESEWKAVDYFQKAIAKDPQYALAYAGIADSFVILGKSGGFPIKQALPKAKEAAIKALELDPSLAEAHTSQGVVKCVYDWDWSGAEDEFKQAIALNPNYALAHMLYSVPLLAMGRVDEAVNESERARDLDPFSFPVNDWLAEVYYHTRRYKDSLRQHQRVLEMYPNHYGVYGGIGNVYEQMKMFPEAFAAFQQAGAAGRGNPETWNAKSDESATALVEAYRRSGYKGYLLKRIQILQQTPHPNLFTGLVLAHEYAQLNDEAHAMIYLERAYDERNPWLPLLQVDPEFDPIRSSPRFRALVGRMGLAESLSEKN